LREIYRKHDKFYQRGRDCIEKVRGVLSFSLLFLLSFAAFLQILGFCSFLLLDGLFELVFDFGSFTCTHFILDPKFNLFAFRVISVLIKGEIEKPSGLCIGLFM
jgi:hypothetical protein